MELEQGDGMWQDEDIGVTKECHNEHLFLPFSPHHLNLLMMVLLWLPLMVEPNYQKLRFDGPFAITLLMLLHALVQSMDTSHPTTVPNVVAFYLS